jgi:N-acetylglucosamine kinase-like BadF-type ATPase
LGAPKELSDNAPMTTTTTPRAAWAIACDLGGTTLRVLARGPAGRTRRLRRGAVPLRALPALLRATLRAWAIRPDQVGALVVAARGVWTPAERRAATARLRSLARRVRVISDVEAALVGALGDGPGILLLAGTGSIALGRSRRGRLGRAGGLGPLLGDEGSAFSIGRAWLPIARRAAGVLALRRLALAPDAVPRVAALAPAALRAARRGHPIAEAIVAGAQTALAGLVADLAARLRLRPPIPVSWAGGLLEDARFRAGVWATAQHAGLRLEPRPPRGSALDAAVEMARLLAARGRGVRRRGRTS